MCVCVFRREKILLIRIKIQYVTHWIPLKKYSRSHTNCERGIGWSAQNTPNISGSFSFTAMFWFFTLEFSVLPMQISMLARNPYRIKRSIASPLEWVCVTKYFIYICTNCTFKRASICVLCIVAQRRRRTKPTKQCISYSRQPWYNEASLFLWFECAHRLFVKGFCTIFSHNNAQ